MTGDATVLIDLTRDEAASRAGMESSWRNKLSKAERSDLQVPKAGPEAGAVLRWLLEAEQKQRQKRGCRAMRAGDLAERWQDAKAEGAGGDEGAGIACVSARTWSAMQRRGNVRS